jgi:hypothetical protein
LTAPTLGAAKTAGTKLYNNAICGNVGLITATNKTGKTVTSKSGGKGKTICSKLKKNVQLNN